VALRYWVYKSNSKATAHSRHCGEWRDVFDHDGLTEWGDTRMKGVADVSIGDRLIAHQTDRNELVGVAQVEDYKEYANCHSLLVRPIELIGTRVRRLKAGDHRIAGIKALEGGYIATAYEISSSDALYLLVAARSVIKSDALYEAPKKRESIGAAEKKAILQAFRDLAPGERRIYERLLRVVARTARLRPLVLGVFGTRCVVCGSNLVDLTNHAECEIAHIAPVHRGGVDSVSNAMPLCRTHHWAFDRGLWAINPATLRALESEN